jgi:hypothetical protein
VSRLYYPKPQTGGLATGKDGITVDAGEVFRKIAKLIPTELVAGYGALVSLCFVIRWETWRIPAVWLCFALCLILTPIYLNKVADRGKPKRNQIIVGTIAFPIWAYQVSGGQIVPQFYDAAIATIVAIIFSLITAAVPMNK